MSDLPKVLKIILAHDDDDAESAESDYHSEGFDDQYVLEIDGVLVGVTGYRKVEATEGTCWLSWTYLEKSYRGKGHGKGMLKELISTLQQEENQKLFVKVSDYKDPEHGDIYYPAMQMYLSLGFQEEVINNDFYDDGENQHILGLNLIPKAEDSVEEEYHVEEEKPIIRFNGLHEIAETDGAYTFSWEVLETKKLFGKRNFSVEDLIIGLRSAKDDDGRKVFLTFPSNLPLIHKPLQTAGFKYSGRLTDYYEPGVHEMHFIHDLDNL